MATPLALAGVSDLHAFAQNAFSFRIAGGLHGAGSATYNADGHTRNRSIVGVPPVSAALKRASSPPK